MATKRKSTGKNTSNKENAEKPAQLTIISEIQMGIVELSETQAVSVSLIRNARQQDYISICRVYRTKKDATWKPRSALWLPFTKMDKIGDVICHAYNEGLKLGCGNAYKSTPLIYAYDGDESSPDDQKHEPKPLELMPKATEQNLFDN